MVIVCFLPCALAGSELVLDIVDGVPGSLADSSLVWRSVISASPSADKRRRPRAMTYRLALGGGVDELFAEVLPVLVVRCLVDDDLLVVV